jgi:sulfite exporter TauE/SafE
MPISMKELDEAYRRTYRRLVAGIFVVYGTILLVVLSVLIGGPKVASSVWQTAQSQLMGANAVPAPEPVRRAEPAGPMRTVKAD